ncbi:MAG: secretion protein HlyD, partial [Gammaproteobacteria bacterium]|nr:secretion protein HlyD [Gammaproteobacteria bacterium]
MKANIKAVIAVAVISVLLVIAILNKPEVGHDSHGHGHEHGDHDQEEYAKGPHGGRLLVQNDFALEVTIYETGLPPEFRVYAYHDDQAVDAEKVMLDIELTRIGNRKDRIRFTPTQGYLRGDAVVVEPHSFEVSVSAEYQGKAYAWHYDNFEGRTQIPADIADEMNIQTEAAGPVVLTET